MRLTGQHEIFVSGARIRSDENDRFSETDLPLPYWCKISHAKRCTSLRGGNTSLSDYEEAGIAWLARRIRKHSRFFENSSVRSAVNRDSDTPNYRFWADQIHMIRLSKKKQLAKRQLTDNCAVQGAVGHTAWFWIFFQTFAVFSKTLGSEALQIGIQTLQTIVSEQITCMWSACRKKCNLLNVRWRTTVQSMELYPILHDFEDLVKHSRFFRKRLGKKRL